MRPEPDRLEPHLETLRFSFFNPVSVYLKLPTRLLSIYEAKLRTEMHFIIMCVWFSGLLWVLVLDVVCSGFLALASVRPGAQCFSWFLYNKTSEKLKTHLCLRARGEPEPGLATWRLVAALPADEALDVSGIRVKLHAVSSP